MLLLEYHMSVSATKIAAIYKGIMVRCKLRTLIINRKRATLFIQAYIRFRQHSKRVNRRRSDAILILQRYAKSYLV